MAQQLGTPVLDPAYVIGWHVGKAAADRELAVEVGQALSVADGRIAA